MKSRQECRRAAFPNSLQLEISLRAVSISDRPAIKLLDLDPEQEPFAGSVDAIFDELQTSRYPDLEHPFAIVMGKEKVGFFVLREKQALPDWAPPHVVTLHSFRICRACQGKGYGRAGANMAMSWVQRERPSVRQLMLAVNTRNVLAKSVYLKSGFVDTGTIFRGPIGDQNILAAEITRHEV